MAGYGISLFRFRQCALALLFVLSTPNSSNAYVTKSRSTWRQQHRNQRGTSSPVLFSTKAPSEGLIKTISKPGSKDKAVRLGDIATVKYTCYLADDDKAAPFARSEKQKMVVGDGSMVKGWEMALRTMVVGERAIVRVTDPELGYGSKGIPPFIPPNAQLEFDIEVLDSQLATMNIDFDSLANADNTPRTAVDIQAAYEVRQAAKALLGPEREGWEGFLDKAKNYYFFGFFEGETGEEAPWFLRPSITFPLAFAVVGAAFYISIASGAITERGASIKDELDEIILNNLVVSTHGFHSGKLLLTAFVPCMGVDL